MSIEPDLKDYIDLKFSQLEEHIELIFSDNIIRKCSYPHEQR